MADLTTCSSRWRCWASDSSSNQRQPSPRTPTSSRYASVSGLPLQQHTQSASQVHTRTAAHPGRRPHAVTRFEMSIKSSSWATDIGASSESLTWKSSAIGSKGPRTKRRGLRERASRRPPAAAPATPSPRAPGRPGGAPAGGAKTGGTAKKEAGKRGDRGCMSRRDRRDKRRGN